MNYVEIARAMIRDVELYSEVQPREAELMVKTGQWIDDRLSKLQAGSVAMEEVAEEFDQAKSSADDYAREIISIAEVHLSDIRK